MTLRPEGHMELRERERGLAVGVLTQWRDTVSEQ